MEDKYQVIETQLNGVQQDVRTSIDNYLVHQPLHEAGMDAVNLPLPYDVLDNVQGALVLAELIPGKYDGASGLLAKLDTVQNGLAKSGQFWYHSEDASPAKVFEVLSEAHDVLYGAKTPQLKHGGQ